MRLLPGASRQGDSVSMDGGGVVARAIELERSGHREIVLTGVNISAYRSGGDDLASLLTRILAETKRARVRLSSLEPESISEELARALSDSRICPHFHIPVQSGSDRMLDLMRRKYRREAVIGAAGPPAILQGGSFPCRGHHRRVSRRIRSSFSDTRDLVQGIRVSALHVFPFSPRPGTAAASFESRVPQRTSHARAMELRRLSRVLHEQYAKRWMGREVEALLEPSGRRSLSRSHGELSQAADRPESPRTTALRRSGESSG
ncbi:MAG: radical SAM protein [Ignavibacteriales bacterium]|nr:radical SAM protein [Ignavibacteriales bacterium]